MMLSAPMLSTVQTAQKQILAHSKKTQTKKQWQRLHLMLLDRRCAPASGAWVQTRSSAEGLVPPVQKKRMLQQSQYDQAL